MEDVLDLYAQPADPARPVVCFDELPYGLKGSTRDPLPAAPGRIKREDYEYTRQGSCSLLASFCPATGWRQVTVSARRTKREFAEQMRLLVEDHFPDAERIAVVLDNLNTHTLAALYEVFPPARARHIASKLEFHFTPIHGRWLNTIEIEWSLLARQCLNRRLPDIASVQAEADAWVQQRNTARTTADWRFTAADARETLKRLYPLTDHDPPIITVADYSG